MTTDSVTGTGLRRSYGEQTVLDGIDLRVAEGTVSALLGPNAAGKTTMVRILSTVIDADSGEIGVGGHDVAAEPDRVRKLIGMRRRLDLAMSRSGHPLPHLLDGVGMRSRLDLAMSLIGDPRVIFLDEPTTGLDPGGRRDMWQLVRDLAADRVTVLLTTRYLEEADRIALLGRAPLAPG
ncbi:ATP-binding cassette domain-containing protein [Actinoplanes sp. G11-F43]|uniref:ATP-binding cassette domain-containing protein n=1 Tax=Actinoplanes sp. G11-F43 TaxID=3424130 RepID=UPI003D3475D1